MSARPWGVGATLGFSFLIALSYLFAQILAIVAYLAVLYIQDPAMDTMAALSGLENNGMVVLAATLASAPLAVAAILVFAGLCEGWTLREYLGLDLPERRTFMKWLGIAAVVVATSDAITVLLGRPISPPFVKSVFDTAVYTPLLYLAIVGAAPVSEELFFRGFLFRGLEGSRLGGRGTVILTGIMFGLIHAQYDAYGILTACAFGLLLGTARWRTGSTTLTIAMHAAMNLVACLEAAFL